MNIGISVDGQYCTAAFSLSDGRLFSLTDENGSLKSFPIKDGGIKSLIDDLRTKLEQLDEAELSGQRVVARFSFPDGMAKRERDNIKRGFEDAGVECQAGNRLIDEDRTQLCLFAYERIHSFSHPLSDKVSVICVGREQIDVLNLRRNDTKFSFEIIDYYDTNQVGRDERSIGVDSFEPDKSAQIINNLISDSTGQVLIFDCRRKDESDAHNYIKEIVSYLEKSWRHVVKAGEQRDYSALGAALLNNNISVPYWNGLLTDIELSISGYREKKTIKSINGLKEFETNHCIIVPREELCPGGLRLEEHNPGRRQGAEDRCIYQERIMDSTHSKDIRLEFELGGTLSTDD